MGWKGRRSSEAGQGRREAHGADRCTSFSASQARITGFLNVFSPQKKLVAGISISLVGTQRLIFPPTAKTARALVDEDFLTQEVVYKGDAKEKGVWLEKGVTS